MSIFSKIAKVVTQAAAIIPAASLLAPSSKGLATAATTLQTVGGALSAGGLPMPGASFLPGALGALPTLPVLGRAAGKALNYAGSAAGLASLLPNDDAPRKRRGINPLNVKAARRAIRRVKAIRKITTKLEQSLPKQRKSGFGGHTHYFQRARKR